MTQIKAWHFVFSQATLNKLEPLTSLQNFVFSNPFQLNGIYISTRIITNRISSLQESNLSYVIVCYNKT